MDDVKDPACAREGHLICSGQNKISRDTSRNFLSLFRLPK